jgi:hypothetical protein
LFLSCSESPLPTSGTPVSRPSSALSASPSLAASAPFQQSAEEFDCEHLSGVWVRFSDPGFVENERVGLFAKYEGVPAETALLRIWWDYENEDGAFQDVALGPAQIVRRVGDRYDFEVLVEHEYLGLSGPTDLLARTEFILYGKTGNCARNRGLTVTPSIVEPPPGGPAEESCGEGRFCDLADGTVLDTSTGLIWLKNAGCFLPRTWDTAQEQTASLADGQCGLTDGSSPGSWRLPTRAEMLALLDARFTEPRLSNTFGNAQWSEGDAFLGVRSRVHWTSEESGECISNLPGAWLVNVGSGESRCLAQILFAFFWPVR